jgi:16S rRNA (guanine966-N2)-methyltransferase
MRVIGGIHRGRKLRAPDGRGTRPMLARVREAIFNRLAPWVEGGRVLDLFAGTGSLGIEALSRGASHARFVERGEPARRVLNENLSSFDLDSASEVLGCDALAASASDPGPWDIVFFDPPYPLLDAFDGRAELVEVAARIVSGPLAADGVFVFHAPVGKLTESDFPGGLEVAAKVYGTTAIWFLGREES